MYGGIASKIAMLAKKGSAADETPNAIDWSNSGYNGMVGTSTSSTKQITGINVPITLYVTISNVNYNTFYYYRSAQTDYWGDQQSYDVGTIVYLASFANPGGTYSQDNQSQFTISNVSNNDYVTFFVGDFGSNITNTITVRTGSHSGTTIDTFTATSTQ
jgi:hypothetical protein